VGRVTYLLDTPFRADAHVLGYDVRTVDARK